MKTSQSVALLAAAFLLTAAGCAASEATTTSSPASAAPQATATTGQVVTGEAPPESITTTTTSQTVSTIEAMERMTTSTTAAASDDGLAEEYEVYGALIQSAYHNALIIIEDTTANPVSRPFSPSDAARFMRNYHPELGDEIWSDFTTKNEKPSLLERRLTLSVKYVFISTQELQSIFSDSSGWDDFYAKYPGSQGVLTLSRVGFNKAKDTAVLYAANQFGGDGGEGNMVLLKKSAGRWTVQGQSMMWIS